MQVPVRVPDGEAGSTGVEPAGPHSMPALDGKKTVPASSPGGCPPDYDPDDVPGDAASVPSGLKCVGLMRNFLRRSPIR